MLQGSALALVVNARETWGEVKMGANRQCSVWRLAAQHMKSRWFMEEDTEMDASPLPCTMRLPFGMFHWYSVAACPMCVCTGYGQLPAFLFQSCERAGSAVRLRLVVYRLMVIRVMFRGRYYVPPCFAVDTYYVPCRYYVPTCVLN